MKNQMLTKVQKIRSQINELDDERFWLENSVLPPDELFQRISGIIDDMGGKFSTNWNGFDSTSLTASGRILTGLDATATDLGPVLCALLGPEIKSNLKAKIHDSNYEAGPPQKDRPSLLSDIDKRISTLEQQEEKIICEAESVGQTIPRRDDISPSVILEYSD